MGNQLKLIDNAARSVIPSMPPLSPRGPLALHLRHIAPLISVDARGEMYFRTFTEAVEKARYADQEISLPEFESAMDAGTAITEMQVTPYLFYKLS